MTREGRERTPAERFRSLYELGQSQYTGEARDGWWSATNAIGKRMQDGDLCWTRDQKGIYYLGQIGGRWQYLHGDEADSFDIHCVRPCNWLHVGLLDEVPGAVERSFIPARTVQRISDDITENYSRYLYGQLSGTPAAATNSRPDDIVGLLSPLNQEDLAALYLQVEGYLLVPSKIKISTANYEWVMLHRETGEKAVLQVKSGQAQIDVVSFAHTPSRVFVVAAKGMIPVGQLPANVTCIHREQLLQFAKDRRAIMPGRIRRYLDWAGI